MKESKVYHSTDLSDWKVSHHACIRWCERIGNTTNTWAARALIQIALNTSLTIPNRYAVTRWVEKISDSHTTYSRKHGIRYHIAGAAIVITGGNRVITVLKASTEDYATVLTWLMTGFWLPEEVQETNPAA